MDLVTSTWELESRTLSDVKQNRASMKLALLFASLAACDAVAPPAKPNVLTLL